MASNNLPSPIRLNKEINKYVAHATNSGESYFANKIRGLASSFFDPLQGNENIYGNLKTADRYYYRVVDCETLRRVSSKAWIINLCITNIIKKVKPFLKPSTNRNLRGFVIHKIGEDVIKAAGEKSKQRDIIEQFLLNTGFSEDSSRDNFSRFCTKIVRDILEIDVAATEIGYTRFLKPYAFMAVDAATIEKVIPGQENNLDKIEFVQIINNIPTTFYPKGTLIFDYQNARTDILYPFYGFSIVEQAINLISSSINAFNYNAGFFTENKLPRGMLLLDGDASQETIEQMEDYITDIMSGNSSFQWRVPIIPSGNGSGGDTSIKWISLTGTNKEMEFQTWLDFLTSGIVSFFGCSMDELGLHSSKSQPIIERNTSPEIEASKSLVLGDTLSFLQQYINKIIKKVFPDYELEFVGYERDDPEKVIEITKKELETYKTLNEVRKEKGLPRIEVKWADSCPANAQFTQMYQAEQQGQEGMESGLEDEEDGQFDNWNEENNSEQAEQKVEENKPDFSSVSENEDSNIEKSFGKKDIVIINI